MESRKPTEVVKDVVDAVKDGAITLPVSATVSVGASPVMVRVPVRRPADASPVNETVTVHVAAGKSSAPQLVD